MTPMTKCRNKSESISPQIDSFQTGECVPRKHSKSGNGLETNCISAQSLADDLVGFARDHAKREEHSRLPAARMLPERQQSDHFLKKTRGDAEGAIPRDELMGTVSHDLRNLLTGIALQARVLANLASDSDEGRETLYSADRIERYVADMDRLIGGLVDMTRGDEGRFPIDPQPGDVVELISEAIAPFSLTARAKNVSFVFTSAARILPGIFDWERMHKVLASLISNLLELTPGGGAITLQVVRTGENLCITIFDTGIRNSEDPRGDIQRFEQLDGTNPQALGLELFISKCIVEAHGGRIWVEMNPIGMGIAFQITIPASGATSVMRTESASHPPGACLIY